MARRWRLARPAARHCCRAVRSEIAVATEVLDLAHDALQRRGAVGLVLAARRQFALGEQVLERDAAAGDAALDRADRAAADLGRFLVGKAARADQDQSL